MPNALAQETSPYLRQHAENPVDWLPWGPPALALARERDVPLLLSIGYSSCHWCHVMEHESFEDPRVAALMNQEFVCVKVDREERPDIDALYMEAVQGMTGHGGWPLNVFLTPDQLPFYGGTYFPPQPRHGMPAWSEVLQAIAELWRERAPDIRADGERLRTQLAGGALLEPSREPLQASALHAALDNLKAIFDTRHGGFGGGAGGAGGPQFPQAPVLEFLLTQPRGHDMALQTLRAIAAGGIHDQVGGGFHRYAVDPTWTVPHFEKMLYDNALLARAYLHGFQLTGDPTLRRVCESTLDWALRDMLAPEGGFYAALDADSPGGEGSFYVWTLPELHDLLAPDDAQAATAWFGATARGNFAGETGDLHGLNVLQAHGPEPPPPQRERIRQLLLAARQQRPRPALDDKRLTSWNALMISALADAGAGLGADGGRYLQAAVACADFVLRELRDDRGDLLRTYNAGRAQLDGYLEDHAFLLEALLALFEATCHEPWLQHARALADQLIARFADPDRGGFYTTAADHETLICRRKDIEDSPIPSGSSSAALGLLRLAQLTGDRDYERHARDTLRLVYQIAPRHPTAFGHALQALHWQLSPARPLACRLPGSRRLQGGNLYGQRTPPAAARQGGGDPP
ncbi:MAG TPA: thioredoxin domain-containing protein [Solirubrobacteraceae bacterium]|nr:thioredoxin domain-containing protein [Solirubrobacteraceae bacterium]